MSPWLWWLILLFIGFGAVRPATAVPTVNSPTPPHYQTGRATYYYKGLMQHVADKRGIGLGDASGYSTYPNCNMIGSELSVSVLDPRSGKWSAWSIKRIVDCSQPRDYQRHVAEGLVELSWEDALRYGYAKEGHTVIRYFLIR